MRGCKALLHRHRTLELEDSVAVLTVRGLIRPDLVKGIEVTRFAVRTFSPREVSMLVVVKPLLFERAHTWANSLDQDSSTRCRYAITSEFADDRILHNIYRMHLRNRY